eukprot:SAG11_NODE_3933_length_2143_cov_2.172211_3_plen_59_part_00
MALGRLPCRSLKYVQSMQCLQIFASHSVHVHSAWLSSLFHLCGESPELFRTGSWDFIT